jgi:hypothetical protein
MEGAAPVHQVRQRAETGDQVLPKMSTQRRNDQKQADHQRQCRHEAQCSSDVK